MNPRTVALLSALAGALLGALGRGVLDPAEVSCEACALYVTSGACLPAPPVAPVPVPPASPVEMAP